MCSSLSTQPCVFNEQWLELGVWNQKDIVKESWGRRWNPIIKSIDTQQRTLNWRLQCTWFRGSAPSSPEGQWELSSQGYPRMAVATLKRRGVREKVHQNQAIGGQGVPVWHVQKKWASEQWESEIAQCPQYAFIRIDQFDIWWCVPSDVKVKDKILGSAGPLAGPGLCSLCPLLILFSPCWVCSARSAFAEDTCRPLSHPYAGDVLLPGTCFLILPSELSSVAASSGKPPDFFP